MHGTFFSAFASLLSESIREEVREMRLIDIEKVKTFRFSPDGLEFNLGDIYVLPLVFEWLEAFDEDIKDLEDYLTRHSRCDWGHVSDAIEKSNDEIYKNPDWPVTSRYLGCFSEPAGLCITTCGNCTIVRVEGY